MTQDRIYLTNDAIPSIVPYVFPKDIQQMIPWTPQKRPAVLILPGGGYAHVSDREGHPIALSFMQRGYQAFVLDRSEERRVGKSVDLGGRRIIKKNFFQAEDGIRDVAM